MPTTSKRKGTGTFSFRKKKPKINYSILEQSFIVMEPQIRMIKNAEN